MKNSRTKTRKSKQRAVRSRTKLAILCGLVACLYVGYRMVLVAYPVSLLSQFNGSQNVAAAVCAYDDSVNLRDPQPALSVSYQNHIRKQPQLTSNLVTNSALTQFDADSDQPIGYEQNTQSDTNSYEVLQDAQTGQNYLRATDTSKTPTAPGLEPSWLMTPVLITAGGTYRYGFQYRSDIPLEVTIEYTAANNPAKQYTPVVILPAASSWKNFTAHARDTGGYTDFRVIVIGTEPGYVDTANFDVRQIASAGLPEGLVTIAFDDGWQSVSSHAVDLLDKHGLRTTQYVISDVADDNTGEYMNYDTIRKLKKSGHEIGSHSLRHCNQTMLDEKAVQDNAILSKQTLEKQQLGPVQSFAYPLGQYDNKTQRIFPAHYTYVRTSDQGYNDKYFDTANVHSMGVLDTTTDAEFKSWLDYAAKNKVWVVIVYHRIDESGAYSVTHETLDRQLMMIKQSGMDVLPLSEAASRTKT